MGGRRGRGRRGIGDWVWVHGRIIGEVGLLVNERVRRDGRKGVWHDWNALGRQGSRRANCRGGLLRKLRSSVLRQC